MVNFQQTRGSGSKFEDQIVSVIGKYTNSIWRNIRIETLLTASGTTELDILFCYNDIVFIVEAKNVSSIIGDYNFRNWSFVGSRNPQREVKEYSALNTITQNNIHIRSFKDCFYAYFQDWPATVSLIVVPNDCKVSPDISESVYTISQLDKFLATAASWGQQQHTIHRRVASMIANDGTTVERPDFVADPTTGVRYKRKGGGG